MPATMASRELRRAVRSGDLATVKTLVNGKDIANQISNAHVGSTLLFAAVQVRCPADSIYRRHGPVVHRHRGSPSAPLRLPGGSPAPRGLAGPSWPSFR